MTTQDHLQPIVSSLLDNLQASIQDEVRARVEDAIIQKVATTEINNIVIDVTKKQLAERLSNYNLEATTRSQLDTLRQNIIDQLRADLIPKFNADVDKEINKALGQIDMRLLAAGVIETKVANLIHTGSFPNRSIPCTSINLDGFQITGDNIIGGIIQEFGSTGIEDRATHVQMTLMDHATVFEGPLWTPSLQVKGDALVEGTLTIDGDVLIKGDIASDSPALGKLINLTADKVRTSLDTALFTQFSTIVSQQINSAGLDLNKITQNGREVISGNQLGYHIVDSNLQRLGMVRDLQTLGESYLSETLYVAGHRVGINTMDPDSVLSIWDQEVEIVAKKIEQDTAYIGTTRSQPLVLGSNRNRNIVLTAEGDVKVTDITVGGVNLSSSATGCPNGSGTKGQIVFNENPDLGGYIGWVCLGGTRWAGFGQIEG